MQTFDVAQKGKLGVPYNQSAKISKNCRNFGLEPMPCNQGAKIAGAKITFH